MLMQMPLCFAFIFSCFSCWCFVAGGLIKQWPPADFPSTEKLEQEVESLDSAVPFLKSFERKIHKLPPAQQQQLEASILQRAESEAAEEAKEAGGCVPDYSAPCPRSWLPRSDSETSTQYCDAPKDYKGYCERSKSFDFFPENAKADWANSCEAEWPCKGDATHACSTGVRDFTLPCPEGFALRPDGESCEAIPGSYSGMCPLVANFSGFSDAAKNSWSMTCGAFWPCEEDCVAAYDAVCPQGWEEEEELWCRAPSAYTATNRCEGRWNFRYFTKEMKKEFEKACQARFPCENTCKKDYTAPCPKGWIEEQKSACKAPRDDPTACNINRASFALMTLSEKKQFERECRVNWPCEALDACAVNWDLPCPVGWNAFPATGKTLAQMTAEKNWFGAACESPDGASPECGDRQNFQSEAEKRKFASMCNLKWPCVELEREKEEGVISTTARIPILAGQGPRPPTPVTDRREVGKRGPVKHETGEIFPKELTRLLPFSRTVKIQAVKAAPAAPPVKTKLIAEEEEEARKLRPLEKAREARRGFYGGLAVGYHLLGSST